MALSPQTPSTQQPNSALGPFEPIVAAGRWLLTNNIISGFTGLLGIIATFFPGVAGQALGVLLILLVFLVLAQSILQAWLTKSSHQGASLRVEQVLSILSAVVTLVTFAFVITWFWRGYNEQPLTNRPLRAHAWGINGASGILTVDSDATGIFYRLGYTLPDTDTYAGLSFTFNEPQQLARFSALRVGISFEGDNPLCAVFLKREETPDDQREPTQDYFDMRPVGFSASDPVEYLIPLEELSEDVALDQFREVGFQTGGSNIGEGACRIHEVTLVR